MNINKKYFAIKLLSKNDTEVGEVYTDALGEVFYLRCQGGFVILTSGSYINFSDETDEEKWRHVLYATLHLNN